MMIQRLAGIAMLAVLSGTALVANAESGDPQQGKVKFQGCMGCHASPYASNAYPNFKFPKLAGQHSDYLLVALKAYQTDNNSKVGRSNPIMAGQAKQFTLAELKVMANYIGSLPSDLKTVPQSPLHKP